MATLSNDKDKLFKNVKGITEDPSNPLWSHSGPYDLLTKQCPACHKAKLALFTNFLEVGSPLAPDKGLSECCLQCIALEKGMLIEEAAATDGPVWKLPRGWTPADAAKFRHSNHIHKEILKDGQVLIALDELNYLPFNTPRLMKKQVKAVAQQAMNDDSILRRIQPASGVTFYKILGLLVKRTLVTKDYQLRAVMEEARARSEDDFQLHYAAMRKRNLHADRDHAEERLKTQEAAEAESSAEGAREAPLVNAIFDVGAVRGNFTATMEEARAMRSEAEAESEAAPAKEGTADKRQKTV